MNSQVIKIEGIKGLAVLPLVKWHANERMLISLAHANVEMLTSQTISCNKRAPKYVTCKFILVRWQPAFPYAYRLTQIMTSFANKGRWK